MDDGVAKTPPYFVVTHFCSRGIQSVWPHSQKFVSLCPANFRHSHSHNHMRGNDG